MDNSVGRRLSRRSVQAAIGAVVVIALLIAGVAAVPRGTQVAAQTETTATPEPQGASIPVEVVAAQTTSLQQTTTLTGEFRPNDTLQVVARVSAIITGLPVDVGQVVPAGGVLVELDRETLEANLAQAQAQVASAQANLAKIEAGARPEDIAAARAATQQAQERLAQAQTQAGAVRAQDIATAEAAIAQAEARVRQVNQGPTAADIAQAEATLRGAQAGLQQVLDGPQPQDIDVAIQTLNQARDTRASLASQLATLKEQARIAMEQAMSAVSAAQSRYGATKLVYEEAERTGKDPNIPEVRGAPKGARDLTDIKLRQYKADFEAAEQALKQAEQALEARKLAYEDAKQQEITGLQTADAQVQTAQAQIDKLTAGATEAERAAAQSTVDQAQAMLDMLLQPARESDVAAAQAAVDQARATLAKLQASPTEVGVAQAAVAQQQALAEKAADPYVPADLAAAQAQIQTAEAQVKTAEVALRDATITAPFAGVVAAKNVSTGALAAPGTVLLEFVSQDVRGLFTVEEAQVGQVQVGRSASLTTTAYPGETFPGTVTVINPTADPATRSFGVRIDPQNDEDKLRAGMFAQAELVTQEQANALVVPEAAVLSRDGKTIVFVVENNQAREREVTTGLSAAGQIEIVSGVQAGEPVVVVGQNLLTDGDTVTVRDE